MHRLTTIMADCLYSATDSRNDYMATPPTSFDKAAKGGDDQTTTISTGGTQITTLTGSTQTTKPRLAHRTHKTHVCQP